MRALIVAFIALFAVSCAQFNNTVGAYDGFDFQLGYGYNGGENGIVGYGASTMTPGQGQGRGHASGSSAFFFAGDAYPSHEFRTGVSIRFRPEDGGD